MSATVPVLGPSRQALSVPDLGRDAVALYMPSRSCEITQGQSVLNKLRELRLARGWTRQEAADAAGMSFGQFVKLERGERRLTDYYLAALARAFEVPVYSLLEG